MSDRAHFRPMGALRGVLIHDAIYRTLREKGLEARYLFGVDDFDPVDEIPKGEDEHFGQYIGWPLCNTPAPLGGTASDIKVQAEQAIKAREDLAHLIAERTGQSLDRITTDFDRDRWFTPEAARDYGIIDRVLTRPVGVPA